MSRDHRHPIGYSRLETDDEVRARLPAETFESDDDFRSRLRQWVLELMLTAHATYMAHYRQQLTMLAARRGAELDNCRTNLSPWHPSSVHPAARKSTPIDMTTVERRLTWVYPATSTLEERRCH